MRSISGAGDERSDPGDEKGGEEKGGEEPVSGRFPDDGRQRWHDFRIPALFRNGRAEEGKEQGWTLRKRSAARPVI
jgi:hypothetical protein